MNHLSEKFFLRALFLTSIFSAVLSLWLGMFIHSNALILSGMLSLVDVVLIITIIISLRFLMHPPTETFRFGFFKLEPLIICLEAGCIIAICCQGIMHALRSYLHHESITHYSLSFLWITFNILINLIVYMLLRSANKRRLSALIYATWQNCKTSILIKLIIWLGFACVLLSYAYQIHIITAHLIFVDPILTVSAALIAFQKPIKVFIISIRNLLDAKPSWINDQVILTKASELSKAQGFNLLHARISVREAGKALFFYFFYTPDEISSVEQLYLFETAMNQYITSLEATHAINFFTILERHNDRGQG